MKGGVLIIGSLLWEDEKNAINKEQGKLRNKWRTNLDLTNKFSVDVPIRYGRKSSTRRCTYTMLFSNSAEVGKAYIVPYKKEILNFTQLKKQAIELSYAEGISTEKYPDRLIATWGAIGIAFNEKRKDELSDIVENWHQEFKSFRNSNSFKLPDEKPSILDNGELNFELKIPDNIDYVFATPVVPNVKKYPSIEKVAKAILESKPQYDTYLIQNYECGIRVKDDKKIIRRVKQYHNST